MSHASLLVAIPESELRKHKGDFQEAVAWEMKPFDENGHWFKKGSRWDWWGIGGRYDGRFAGKNVIKVSEIDLAAFLEHKKEGLRENYREAMGKSMSPESLDFVYGIKSGETLDQYIDRNIDGVSFPAAYAFLSGRSWHEGNRLGWFGGSAATECEIKTKKKPKRCLHRSTRPKARIVCWYEPWEEWQKKFYDRFVKNLAPETTLIVVDYHV